ncbi:Peroxisome biogenesis factor [Arachis hypogaea]|nr:Peroxisome biogenesis factor [Arachis hypogaea]
MLFYFEGLYYHISKRASGIRYLFIGKPSNQRPRYQILGVFLLIQLCVIAAEGLRRRSLSSVAGSVHQASFASQQRSAGHGLPVLNEEGNLASLDTDEGGWVSNSSSSEVADFWRIHNMIGVKFIMISLYIHITFISKSFYGRLALCSH